MFNTFLHWTTLFYAVFLCTCILPENFAECLVSLYKMLNLHFFVIWLTKSPYQYSLIIFYINPHYNNAFLALVLSAWVRLWGLGIFEMHWLGEICLYELEWFVSPLIILRDPSPISHLYSVIFWRQLFYALYCYISPLGKENIGQSLVEVLSSAGMMLFDI